MSDQSFFFYDLETSGFDARKQRIMQFAGQRTDLSLKPIGEPINMLVALAEDVLPNPGAVLVTGITPQQTRDEGYTEADFLKILHQQVITPGTIVTGFNSVRFDDEFMRYTLYRNFYDPYEWQWQDGRSRWDLLDVIRMTRALRPEGIEWPFDGEGQPTNRLELLTKANSLGHEKAHDALSDVHALIAVAKLIKEKQPKLFDYLLQLRNKRAVADVANVDDPQPFVYSSGRYPKGILHTTVAYPLAPSGRQGAAIVYDLRHDPDDWAKLSVDELKDIRFANYEKRQMEGFVPLPAKELCYNRCPAVAPIGVLDEDAQERIKLDLGIIQTNLAKLRRSGLTEKLLQVFTAGNHQNADCDGQLYDGGFISDKDKVKMSALRAATPDELAGFQPDFADKRLHALLVRYKARNYPQSLGETERSDWEAYRTARFNAGVPGFMKELQRLAATANDQQQYLLQELHLWAESIAPAADS